MQNFSSLKKSEIYNLNDKNNIDFVELGNLLKEQRENHSLSIGNLKELTHIPIHHIVAIENGLRSKLPEDLYLSGFIRKYAKVVGLTEDPLIKRYLAESYSNSEVKAQVKTKQATENQEEFDLLFQNNNVVQFRPENESFLKLDKIKEKFPMNVFKVYHFYLIFGVFLFLFACYLMLKTNSIESNDNSYDSYIAEEIKDTEPILEAEVETADVEAKSEPIQNIKNEEAESENDIESSFAFDDESKTQSRVVVNNSKVETKVKPVIQEAPRKLESTKVVVNNNLKNEYKTVLNKEKLNQPKKTHSVIAEAKQVKAKSEKPKVEIKVASTVNTANNQKTVIVKKVEPKASQTEPKTIAKSIPEKQTQPEKLPVASAPKKPIETVQSNTEEVRLRPLRYKVETEDVSSDKITN